MSNQNELEDYLQHQSDDILIELYSTLDLDNGLRDIVDAINVGEAILDEVEQTLDLSAGFESITTPVRDIPDRLPERGSTAHTTNAGGSYNRARPVQSRQHNGVTGGDVASVIATLSSIAEDLAEVDQSSSSRNFTGDYGGLRIQFGLAMDRLSDLMKGLHSRVPLSKAQEMADSLYRTLKGIERNLTPTDPVGGRHVVELVDLVRGVADALPPLYDQASDQAQSPH
ncbi:hypothetical protein AB0M20_14555 [Actinoplanes sp. NPDC051633]|uniref:hypothetical protein n=1 Tax=Actinoplanes sp. NPDC051633 TaxID=3155670 RepID=UPI003434ECDA